MEASSAPAFPTPPHARKQDIRRELRIRRAERATDAAVSVAVAEGLARTLLASGLAPRAGDTVAAYLSRPGEPGTGSLRAALAEHRARVLVPWLEPDRDLDWVSDPGPETLTGAPMRPPGDRLGRDAVRSAALVLLPALAVDRSGRRLGQGGGSYDRVLARLSPPPEGPLVVAVIHDHELLAGGTDLPEEPHDRRVHAVLTPTRVVALTNR